VRSRCSGSSARRLGPAWTPRLSKRGRRQTGTRSESGADDLKLKKERQEHGKRPVLIEKKANLRNGSRGPWKRSRREKRAGDRASERVSLVEGTRRESQLARRIEKQLPTPPKKRTRLCVLTSSLLGSGAKEESLGSQRWTVSLERITIATRRKERKLKAKAGDATG